MPVENFYLSLIPMTQSAIPVAAELLLILVLMHLQSACGALYVEPKLV